MNRTCAQNCKASLSLSLSLEQRKTKTFIIENMKQKTKRKKALSAEMKINTLLRIIGEKEGKKPSEDDIANHTHRNES
jgi:hypothetical protein